MHKACRTLVDLFRPSTTGFGAKKDVDGRDKHGHDGELTSHADAAARSRTLSISEARRR
jgi:hypothetical protein